MKNNKGKGTKGLVYNKNDNTKFSKEISIRGKSVYYRIATKGDAYVFDIFEIHDTVHRSKKGK